MKIGELIKNLDKSFFSLEFFPPADEAQLPGFYAAVDELNALKPLFASVTYGAGGARQNNTIRITSELVKRGIPTMTHLTCVGATSDNIRNFLNIAKAAGVENVLALRGDPPKDRDWNWNEGEFRHARDLVEFIKKEQPDFGVGVAAYPAPHPESATYSEDRRHTAEKLASGADFAITQLFFDVREYIELVESLRKNNITLPVIPGIMTIQSFESLKRVLGLCGATIPARLYLELEEAHNKSGVEAVREAGIAFALSQIKQLLEYGAPGIHLYTLNKSALCKRIIGEAGLAN